MEVKHIMVESIGAILLLYGVIGLIGLVVAYGWLHKPHGPLQRLRERLQRLDNILQESLVLTQRANELAPQLRDLSHKTYQNLDGMIKPIRQGAEVLDDTAVLMRGAASLVNEVVDRVIGPTETVMAQQKPHSSVGDQLDDTKEKVDELGDLIVEMKYFAKDTTRIADELIPEVLQPLPHQVEEAQHMVQELSHSKTLDTIPQLGLAYFGSIHVALALVGVALLIL
jgi:hypothetical protein